jgi:hypothetical protein
LAEPGLPQQRQAIIPHGQPPTVQHQLRQGVEGRDDVEGRVQHHMVRVFEPGCRRQQDGAVIYLADVSRIEIASDLILHRDGTVGAPSPGQQIVARPAQFPPRPAENAVEAGFVVKRFGQQQAPALSLRVRGAAIRGVDDAAIATDVEALEVGPFIPPRHAANRRKLRLARGAGTQHHHQ